MVLGHDVLTIERTKDIKISEDVSFDSMLLSPVILAGLKTSGFYVPSPIQLHGIPLGKCGFDLLLEAKSGTGKTAVFSIIALEKLSLDKGVQSIILAPTREIASQICDVIKTIGAYYKGLCVEVVMGGLPYAEDVEKFNKNVHIVVGSPGRLHYLIKDKHIDVSSVRLMVLDEADKLVEKSFLPDINYIFSILPSQKQIIMSSATFAEDVRLIMKKYVQNVHHICPDSNSVLLGIDQNVLLVSSHVNIVKQTKNRYEELNQILSKKQFKQCLIFCNYQVRVSEVHRMLNHDKWPADKLHGQQEQADRLEALKILQSYQCRILVTTDLAARGIDASNVDLVINFEPPYDWQTYLHRIGRAGRFGSYGSAVTIICKGDEENKFQQTLGSINIPFNLKYLWSGEPYLLEKGQLDEQINQKKEKITHKNQYNEKSTQILGIKETYEELWKMLSADLTDEKSFDDIPTFESLNNSFHESNGKSNVNAIESFSDLLASFQNHELQSIEQPMYKPVEVNKLIIPSMMFNRNHILQNIQTNSGTSAVEYNEEIKNYEKPNSSKRRESIDDKNAVKNNGFIKSTTKNKTPNKNWKNKYIYIENGSTDIHSEDSCSSSDIPGPDSLIKNSSIKPSPLNNGFKNYCKKSTENEQNKKNDENHKDRQKENSCDGSDYISNGEFDIETYNQHYYNEEEKSLIAANLPPAFGKIKKNKSKILKKHNVSSPKSRSKESKRKGQMPEYVPPQESSDDDNTSNGSYRSLRWRSCSQWNSPDLNSSINDHRSTDKVMSSQRNSPESSSSMNYHRSISSINTETEDRQQEFNAWYQQLQLYKQMIEQYVYIQMMSSSHS